MPRRLNCTMARMLLDVADELEDVYGGDDEAIPQVKEAADLVDRLPVYEDTGKPFVPVLDPCWKLRNGLPYPLHPTVWLYPATDRREWDAPYYSTEQAALTAAQKEAQG